MPLTWTPQAWEDYLYWQRADKRTAERISELLRDAMRNPFEGLGKLWNLCDSILPDAGRGASIRRTGLSAR